MKGTIMIGVLVLGAVAGALTLSGCKKGKESSTAADQGREPPPASGTMSLQGMYSYMADAGIFVDCATGERWPVAAEEDNAALERAYGQARTAPGAPLLVTVEGRLQWRPKVDAHGKQKMLIVDRFVRTSPGKTCGHGEPITLDGTHWALFELNGKIVTVGAGRETAYLELNAKKASAYGFAGCNRFFASYQTSGSSLTFGAMGATRMACPEGMDREQELLTALGATSRYQIQGSKLSLFAGETLVARFEARPSAE
jgi:copper homeostasis protein (lipoprotein)